MTTKTFLSIGCGPKHRDRITAGLNTTAWQALRFDGDISVSPDIAVCRCLQASEARIKHEIVGATAAYLFA